MNKANKVVRKILVTFGLGLLIFELFNMSKKDRNSDDEDFSSKEFDDIW